MRSLRSWSEHEGALRSSDEGDFPSTEAAIMLRFLPIQMPQIFYFTRGSGKEGGDEMDLWSPRSSPQSSEFVHNINLLVDTGCSLCEGFLIWPGSVSETLVEWLFVLLESNGSSSSSLLAASSLQSTCVPICPPSVPTCSSHPCIAATLIATRNFHCASTLCAEVSNRTPSLS